MAKRRMFNLNIVDDDVFLNMPTSAQLLYFHLGMRADDDGFITPLKIMRMVGANHDDLQILIAKRYVLAFDSGVVVIKHWPIQNAVKKDRYLPTTYKKEIQQLTLNEWGVYTEKRPTRRTIKVPLADLQHNKVLNDENDENGTQMEPQYSIGKVSIGKVSTSTMESAKANSGIKKRKNDDEVSVLYYQVVKSLGLPVMNHKNLQAKITELGRLQDRPMVVKYLEFMRDNYTKLEWDFKPDVSEGLDIFRQRVKIINSIKRAKVQQQSQGVVL